MKRLQKIFLVAGLTLALSVHDKPQLMGQTTTWIGGTSSDMGDPTNWSNGVPSISGSSPNNGVAIFSGGNLDPTLNSSSIHAVEFQLSSTNPSSYTFDISQQIAFISSGGGIVNNSGLAQVFNLDGGNLIFGDTSSVNSTDVTFNLTSGANFQLPIVLR